MSPPINGCVGHGQIPYLHVGARCQPISIHDSYEESHYFNFLSTTCLPSSLPSRWVRRLLHHFLVRASLMFVRYSEYELDKATRRSGRCRHHTATLPANNASCNCTANIQLIAYTTV